MGTDTSLGALPVILYRRAFPERRRGEKKQAEERNPAGKEGAAPAEKAGNLRFNINLPESWSVG